MTYRERQREATTLARTIIFAILAGLFLIGSLPAFAAISLHLAANADATRTTEYPNGDKPVAGCTPPTGFTEVSIGTGGGEICEQSSTEFDFSVTGEGQAQNNHLAHKDCGGGECQIETRITNTYAGSTENNATIGIGIREAATSTAWMFQIHSLQVGTTVVQCTFGENGTYTNVNGGAGQSRPRYVAVTYHPSSSTIKGFAGDDGSSWTEVCSTTRTLSDDEVYMFGTSRDTGQTLQATIDNFAVVTEIDAYDEGGGGGGGGPTLDTPIENQSVAEGFAVSLSIAANYSGETSYSTGATSFPTGSGLSLNTSTGLVSGIPDADDIAASPFNVDLCGVNAGGTTCDTVQFSVVPVPGDVLVVSTGTTSVNCNTFEGGDRVDPGDILQLDDGNSAPLTISNCQGTNVAPIIIRNDPAGSGPRVFRSNSTAAKLTITNSSGWVLDGTGKWTGAGSDGCGTENSWPAIPASPQCGIVLESTGTTAPTHWLRIDGTSCVGGTTDTSTCTIQGVEIDASAATGGGSGICLSINDHNVSPTLGWRQNFHINDNYIHHCGNNSGAGMYIGPNPGEGDTPFRDFEISYNYLHDISWSAIRLKFTQQGDNLIHHNYVDGSGVGDPAGQHEGITVIDGGDVEIYSNIVKNAGGHGINCNSTVTAAQATDDGPYFCRIYNNIVVNPDNTGLRCADNTTGINLDCTIEYNTSVGAGQNGIQCSADGTNIGRENILASSGSAASSGCTGSNTTGLTSAMGFVDSGSDNYELGAGSPACSAGASTAIASDYEDESRPRGSADDRGADESAACP